MRAGRAEVVLHVLVEERPRPGREVAHHVLADEPARVRQAFGMLSGRGIEEQPRVLRRPCREHDDARRLHMQLSSRIVVLDASHLRALRVRQHARHRRERADLGAGATRLAEISDDRIGERAGGTTDVAPAVVDACGAALVLARIHADGGRHQADAVFGARLHITALRASAGPGIEFLEYLAPRDGRPYPQDEKSTRLHAGC